jgi:hypothetical protein
MVNHIKNKIYPCRSSFNITLPLLTLLFQTKSRLLCQSANSLFEAQLT